MKFCIKSKELKSQLEELGWLRIDYTLINYEDNPVLDFNKISPIKVSSYDAKIKAWGTTKYSSGRWICNNAYVFDAVFVPFPIFAKISEELYAYMTVYFKQGPAVYLYPITKMEYEFGCLTEIKQFDKAESIRADKMYFDPTLKDKENII